MPIFSFSPTRTSRILTQVSFVQNAFIPCPNSREHAYTLGTNQAFPSLNHPLYTHTLTYHSHSHSTWSAIKHTRPYIPKIHVLIYDFPIHFLVSHQFILHMLHPFIIIRVNLTLMHSRSQGNTLIITSIESVDTVLYTFKQAYNTVL